MKLQEHYWHNPYKEGFLLGKEGLDEIKNTLRKRLKDISSDEIKIKFIVQKKNGLVFTTEDVNEISSENNGIHDQITSIDVVYDTDNQKVSIHFTPGEETTAYIQGFSKDDTALLSQDLRECLENNILIFRKFNFIEKFPYIFYSVGFCILLYMLYLLFYIDKSEPTQMILASTDINEKINWLINNPIKSELSTKFLFIIFGWGLGIPLIYSITKMMDYFYPRNIFYIGKQKGIYDRKIELRKNIIWQIGIGGLLISGFWFWLSR